jgi:hypothetical protein
MKTKILLCLVFSFVFVGSVFMEQLPSSVAGYIPPDGFVPNEETAIKIAEAIWFPIYGKSALRKKPYEVNLIDGKIWVVEGTLKSILPTAGGTPYIEIDKYTGAILRVIHTK